MAGANHARLLGESAVWKLVSYGGDVLGQDNLKAPAQTGASPYLRRSLTLPLELRPACAEAFRALPYPSHPDPVPYCFGRSLLQMGLRHQAVKVGRYPSKKRERRRKFSRTDSGPYFGRGVGQLSDRFGKGSRLGNGALLVD